MDPRLPNLVVIGGMKCGTSSLHYYLGLHPQIAMTREKELDFFVADRRWQRGLDWYRSHFREGTKIRGESSPSYTCYPAITGVPERIHAVLPDAKLIYLVRDPIERIVSHYHHWFCAGREKRQLADALRDPDTSPYLWFSRYSMQLEQYLPYFGRESVLVLAQEDLRDSRRAALQRVFRFLQVDESFWSAKFSVLRNVSTSLRRKRRLGGLIERRGGKWLIRRIPGRWMRKYASTALYWPLSSRVDRPVPSEALRRKLEGALREDVDRLREHTGQAFDQWSF